MLLKPVKYVRRAFEVEAVEVTDANIMEVARWCGGEVRTANVNYGKKGRKPNYKKYVKVPVANALSDRQSRAYVGDWVLSADHLTSYKVYTPQAFVDSFQEKAEHMREVVERMEERAREEQELQEEQLEFEPSPAPIHVLR